MHSIPPAGSPRPASYRTLLAQPEFRRLAICLLIARGGDYMWTIVLVLFTQHRYGVGEIAALAGVLNLVPNVLLSPLTGTLLDRYGRRPLVVGYYGVAAAVIALIALLAWQDRLPAVLLLILVVVGTAGRPLGETGLRTLFPTILPHQLWDRANGVDSATFVAATLIGPAAGAAVFAAAGPGAALMTVALVYAASAGVTMGIHEHRVAVAPTPLLPAAVGALGFVLRHPTLRGLAVVVSAFNFANGFLTFALPVLVERQLHHGDALVGQLFIASGLGGVLSSLLTGRLNTMDRERRLMAVGCLGTAVGVVVAGATSSVVVATVGMVLVGCATGPLDVGLFSIRLRRTETAWLGRALAVSQALNRVGLLAGTGLAATLLAAGVTTAFVLCAVITLCGAALVFVVVPRDASIVGGERRHHSRPSPSV